MKKFKYPHFLMMFVDDIIAILLLIRRGRNGNSDTYGYKCRRKDDKSA